MNFERDSSQDLLMHMLMTWEDQLMDFDTQLSTDGETEPVSQPEEQP